MKKNFLLSAALLLPLALCAQKKPLDHSVYDSWQSIKSAQITNKGNYTAYRIVPQEGDAQLVVQNLRNNKQTTIDRVSNFSITPNEKFLVGKIAPTFAQTKAHKKKKGKKKSDTLNDSIFVLNLQNFSLDNLGEMKSYKIGKEGNSFFAYTPKADIYTTDSVKLFNPLIVQELGTNWRDTINNVDQYYFDKSGNQLAILLKPNKKDTINTEKELWLYDLNNKKHQVLSKGFYAYKNPTFDEKGEQLAYLAAKDSILPTNRSLNLFHYQLGEASPTNLIDTTYTKGLPENWHFTSNSYIYFSDNGKRIFTSIAPLVLPQDTITDGDEQAQLDIWHYQDPTVQPNQLKNRQSDLNKTYLAVVNLDNPKELHPLSTSAFERVRTFNKADGEYVISYDQTPYKIAQQWSVSTPIDIYKTDLKSGKRELLIEGFIGLTELSPMGRYLLLYDKTDLNWYSFNIETKQKINLTENIDSNFWDESDDTPSEPYPYGTGGWVENNEAVLIYDQYDIWKIDPQTAQAVCITNKDGKEKKLIYRIINTDSDKKYFDKNEKLLLSVFNKKNKDETLASIYVNAHRKPTQLFKQEPYQYQIAGKAKESNTYIFSKSNFTTTPDIWVTKNYWKSSKQLSHINPQMAEYNWGTVELVHWNAFDGEKLDGLLYKPEDFDPTKKYPMMIYFYETHSDNLNQYHMPQPSWSIINISFYVSRGYLVFCPDIHYTAGLPGESAYNCIVSGAESLAKNSWVDKDNMAIQGQSWGGYQVAYLVTRTNMFKAAGSGAPVSNMTSAYGGIRWGTGTSRQLQYEMGQSRIGGTLWERPELYIANSPLFKADKIETPLLIMHNDNDGAVPWYQGIELFMAMRRLQKPVWMLQYNNEEHNLTKRVNRKDLSIRLQQFFDHYLKGSPAPEWMEKGLPAVRKGKTMGYDLMK